MQQLNTQPFASTMKMLGYAGLIPFVLLLLASVVGDGQLAVQTAESMLFYAAMILTFLGAVHWGYVLSAADVDANSGNIRLYWAVTPSLIAWIALMLPTTFTIVVLMLAFVLCWWIDRAIYTAAGLLWYQQMRNHLTIVVVASLAALLLSMYI